MNITVKTTTRNFGSRPGAMEAATAYAAQLNRRPGTIAVAERALYEPARWQVRYATNVPAGYTLVEGF